LAMRFDIGRSPSRRSSSRSPTNGARTADSMARARVRVGGQVVADSDGAGTLIRLAEMPCAEAGRGAAGDGEGEGVGAAVPWSETSCGAGRRARASSSCTHGGSPERDEQGGGCGSF
jgi:hypothetical protein